MIHVQPIRDLTVDEAGGRGWIAAASGIVEAGEFLYVIADDERALGAFPAHGSHPGRLVSFMPGALPDDPAERKRHKPDLEALALLPAHTFPPAGALLALESGSKPWRRGGLLWQLGERGTLVGQPVRIDIAPLYEALEDELPDLNIEGVTVVAERLMLFQRGNGRGGVNAVVELDLDVALRALSGASLRPDALTGVRRYELGEIDGVRLCFSDATGLPDHRVLFTAVAERGEDTYRDGNCAGACVGLLDGAGNLAGQERLQPPVKVEGVHARLAAAGIELLLVADADDRNVPSPLLRARWSPQSGQGVKYPCTM